MMRIRPRLAGIACALCACPAGTARAQDDAKRACAAAFTNAQRLMRKGSLLEAKKKLLLCGGPECPEIMHADCQRWLSSVEASLPTVVFQASSTTGPPPATVHLSLDGGEATALDGRALSMDPGPHEVVLEAKGFQTASRHFVASEGEKLRREVVQLDPLPVSKVTAALPAKQLSGTSPPVESHSYSRVTLPVVVAVSGAALAGLGAVYFGLKARSDERDLDKCRPECTQDAVNHVKYGYVLANLSIALAAVGVTTAAVLFFRGQSPTSATATLGLSAGPDELGLSATGRF
jgi:hypothetical protein